MKKITDYNFSHSWAVGELGVKPNEDYLVLKDIGDLKQGQLVRFAGFDDVDNHYGIFVFVDVHGRVLEVAGDFSSPTHSSMTKLKPALSKQAG